MLKTIAISDLSTDMFIAEIIETPGAKMPKKKRGMVRDARIIAKFIEMGIQELIIDVERGRDITPIEEKNTTPVSKISDEDIEASLGILKQQLNTRYHDLQLEWGSAKEIFHTSVSIISHSLATLKGGDQINPEYFHEASQAISRSIQRNKDALTWLGKIRSQNNYLFEHSVNASTLMGIFAHACGFSPKQTEDCITGALLHDLGQAFIRDELFERNGPLSPEEYDQVKTHVELGLNILENEDKDSNIIRCIVSQHHEHFDGSGYPLGLKGQDISLFGRMFSIVDTYDAMTNNRHYKEAIPSSAAMRSLLELAGTHFDESLVHQFIKCMGVYPTGSLVRLNTGVLALVIAQTPGHPLKPLVKVIYNAKSHAFIQPEMLDLLACIRNEKIVSYEDPSTYKIDVNAFLPEEMEL